MNEIQRGLSLFVRHLMDLIKVVIELLAKARKRLSGWLSLVEQLLNLCRQPVIGFGVVFFSINRFLFLFIL